ncbi:alpha-ketoglutarate-dependent dioxygenase AlkB [Nakamurella sp. YIM 132087]|uniref:Alpha-ketoglutarate-dependent dioxygenase AlkB n=1 Tax=Nakamurella alba TaxID=2665158 RepID=A0A7K1FN67_9ACTN|nr:alpha-ketoglutarate-dependent dioxygenase AlkB [Nakamurella alba]MTD15605.1 alpha-ketoglutarate-dependent dioxygenase AlkB [Nakamurella alba]
MTAAYQPSMFDLDDELSLAPLTGRVVRHELSLGAWVDECRGWLAGSDEVLDTLLRDVPWRAERRQMYDRDVDVPRLLCWYSERSALPHPVLQQALDLLNEHYAAELGEPFVTAGLCLYRDGRDSVAWHGDRIGRGNSADTMVAILSVGSDRVLALRERPETGRAPGRPGLRLPVGHGDLVVMGGSCQRTWDHAIPKTAKPVGPRVSIQFRPAGVA